MMGLRDFGRRGKGVRRVGGWGRRGLRCGRGCGLLFGFARAVPLLVLSSMSSPPPTPSIHPRRVFAETGDKPTCSYSMPSHEQLERKAGTQAASESRKRAKMNPPKRRSTVFVTAPTTSPVGPSYSALASASISQERRVTTAPLSPRSTRPHQPQRPSPRTRPARPP